MMNKVKTSMFIGTGLICTLVALTIMNGALKVVLDKIKE